VNWGRVVILGLATTLASVPAASALEWGGAPVIVGGGAASGGIYSVVACTEAGGGALQGGAYSLQPGPCAALAADGPVVPPEDGLLRDGFEG
jgi:hypothetical protein